MTAVAVVAYTLLGGGALLSLARIARGPSLLDRVVGTETLLAITALGMAVHAVLTREPAFVPVVLVVSLLGFLGAVSVARFIGRSLVRSAGDGSDVGLPVAAEHAETDR